MSSSDPRSWPDRLVGASLSLLAAVVALYVVVQLVEAIWWVLLIIGGSVAAVTATVAWLRSRHQGW